MLPVGFENKRAVVKLKEKVKKYGNICKNHNVIFVPFVMYSTGRIHKSGIDFLSKLALHAREVRNIPRSTLVNYYVKLLNFTLIKEAAKIIYIKSVENNALVRNANFNMRNMIRVGNQIANEISNPPLVVHSVERTV